MTVNVVAPAHRLVVDLMPGGGVKMSFHCKSQMEANIFYQDLVEAARAGSFSMVFDVERIKGEWENGKKTS